MRPARPSQGELFVARIETKTLGTRNLRRFTAPGGAPSGGGK
jgi:hypothetical protein